MQQLKPLTAKEVRAIQEQMKEQWGSGIEGDYQYFMSSKDKLYIVSRDIAKTDVSKLRLDSVGLYVAEVRNTQVRLSIEGSQLVGPRATKNVLELSREQEINWLRGEDLAVEGKYEGFVILKHGNDFLGSGKFSEGTIFNFIPKARRLLTKDLAS